MRKEIVALCLLIVLSSCSDTDKRQYPSKIFENFTFSEETPLLKRVGNAPDFILEYLSEIDNTDSYSNYTLTKEKKIQLQQMLSILPDKMKKILDERLIGIYFINNFFGSGLADFTISKNDTIYTFMVINPKLFNMTLSEILTLRDSSPFKQTNLSLTTETSKDYPALIYILLHESAHIADYVLSITPIVEEVLFEYGIMQKEGTAFTNNSWVSCNVPTKGNIDNSQLSFYTENEEWKLDDKKLLTYYNALKDSDFVSLYSTQNWAEDLADYTMQYILAEYLDCTISYSITDNNDEIFRYTPMNNKKVLNRAEFISNYLF